MPRRDDDRRPTSWTARVLAPIVLIVVAAAIILVISGTLTGEDDSEPRDRGAETSTGDDCVPDAQDAVENGYYVVQEDDVEGLSGIADKTCVPLETLIELNPNLDPQAIQASNCVDLVNDGCKELASG